jgi:hypothetical protein
MKGIHSMKPNTIAPTTAELATLAATLAAAAPRNVTPETLAERALAVWRACEALQAASNPTVTEQCVAAIAALRASLPYPKRFPITFSEFIALAFKGKRPEDREALFEEYLDPYITYHARCPADRDPDTRYGPNAHERPVTPKDRSAELKRWEAREFEELEYRTEAKRIQDWLAKRNKASAIAKASRAASAKATKLAEAEIAARKAPP